jgi:predicted ATPase with chaperone activity
LLGYFGIMAKDLMEGADVRMPSLETRSLAAPPPRRPQSIAETGLRTHFLSDLFLKILYLGGELSLKEVAGQLAVDFGVAEELFQSLRRDKLVEVKGLVGGNYHLTTTGSGRARASDALAQSSYSGAAPVPLASYIEVVRKQTLKDFAVRPTDMKRAFEHYVASEDLLSRAGAAIVSGTSAFLYGPAGVGKTSLAEGMATVYNDLVWIPHCLEVDNQIIKIYDPVVHAAAPQPDPLSYDRRWVLAERPRVLVGGELSRELLDLQFHPVTKFYAPPLQLKANNGALIIDDLGRQRISAHELLNRWMVPLDRNVDFLTLMGGRSFQVFFDLFVIFATNMNPSDLADEAFLRRIPNKIKVNSLTPEQFHEVFRRVCASAHLSYDPAIVDHVIQLICSTFNRPLLACLPRDIVRLISWEAQYRGRPPVLDTQSVAAACRSYFVDSG